MTVARQASGIYPQAGGTRPPVQVDHLTITLETIELSGTTASYHDVAQLKEALEASPHFPTVKIGHPKTGPDNKTIVFTLTITMAHTREAAS
jgi:Tfp pilus assembly protein PilN